MKSQHGNTLGMKSEEMPQENFSQTGVADLLQEELRTISEKCITCKLCKKECEFLKKRGNPKQIADGFDPSDKRHQSMAFECSLCQLCAAVCPVGLNPANMFLEMRRKAVRCGNGRYPEHARIVAYERRGTSKRYSYYALPRDCDTIFFPGCTLPGTRPARTWDLFEYIRKTIPTLGIVLDCCTKPSHDLGRDDHFHAMFGEMRDYLINNGVRQVLVACPNCYKIFSKYGGKLSVKTVYEFMAQDGLPVRKQVVTTVTVHDSCSVRYEESIHTAVRSLCKRQGLSITEMPHHGMKTLCCGEGGGVGCVSPDYAKSWGRRRKSEANGHTTVTYCAGCASLLGTATPTRHLLDLLFEPEGALEDKVRVSKAPVTYLNRLRIKKRFQKALDAPITRERPSSLSTSTILTRKGIALAVVLGLAFGGYKLVNHYWYVLNSYIYLCEFYWLFVVNNLKNANLDIFKECLVCMDPAGSGFAMVLFSHFMQNYWLPFSKQILALAAISSYGIGVGSVFTYVSFAIVGLVSFGLGVFFLGDISPCFKEQSQNHDVQYVIRWARVPFLLFFGVPYIPISIAGIAGGFFRIPAKKMAAWMLLGLAVRFVWLVSMPQIFM